MKAAKTLLSAGELAKRLGTTPSILLTWYHEGKIPAEVAEGVFYRFDKDAVVEAMECRNTRLTEFHALRQDAVARGVKLRDLPGATQFRAKMDAELIAERTRETEKALIEKQIPVPSAPIKCTGHRILQWALVV